MIRRGIYEDLEFRSDRRGGTSRPYVAINMVSSVDGRATTAGKASRIGGEADRAAMRRLRAKADAVVIGAGTLRAERLSLGLDAPRRSSGHPADARGPQPLAVVLSASGDVPLDNLILEPGQSLLIFVADDAPGHKTKRLRARGAAVIAGRREERGRGLDLREVVGTLASDHRVEVLLAEGGPTLNRALVSAGLADELFLTLAPKLLGGPLGAEEEASFPTPKTIIDGEPFEHPANLEILSVHLVGDELFLRYSLRGQGP